MEHLLGGRKWSAPLPEGEDVEEVSLMPYDEHRYESKGYGGNHRQAYDEDEDDEMTGNTQNVQCANS